MHAVLGPVPAVSVVHLTCLLGLMRSTLEPLQAHPDADAVLCSFDGLQHPASSVLGPSAGAGDLPWLGLACKAIGLQAQWRPFV